MNIYVGNLAMEITEAELRQELQAFGQVESVAMMNDKYISSGQQRGYSYVVMPNRREGEAAIAELGGKLLKGRNIFLIEAISLSPESSGQHNRRSPRSRTAFEPKTNKYSYPRHARE